jgi:hypothetical protein
MAGLLFLVLFVAGGLGEYYAPSQLIMQPDEAGVSVVKETALAE